MKISSKGQVTIPIEIRNKFGLSSDTEIMFIVTTDNKLVLQKKDPIVSKGQKLIKHLTNKASVKMSTDEIMNLVR